MENKTAKGPQSGPTLHWCFSRKGVQLYQGPTLPFSQVPFTDALFNQLKSLQTDYSWLKTLVSCASNVILIT